jgi:Fe-S oxidoreductase
VSAFADNESLLGLSLKLGKLFSPIMNSNFGKSIVLPTIAKNNLRRRYPTRISNIGEIAFFHGCADNLLHSWVGDSVFRVFDRLNLKISMPEQKCCGLPYEVYGLKENLIEKAKFNIDNLENFKAVITGCASCLLRLKEYKSLFGNNDPYKKKAEELSLKCFDICQYLNKLDIDYSIFDIPGETTITYHNPCHLRAAGLRKEPEKLLRKLSDIKIIHPIYSDSCCAQAGSYGYIHFKEAKGMFSKKREEYSKMRADYLMTSCPACQMKIRAEMGDRFKVVHPIEILSDRLGNK